MAFDPSLLETEFGAEVCANSTVTPLVDGTQYFDDLNCAINKLVDGTGTRGIYIMAWALNKDFVFPNGESLMARLEAAASAGVDVRILLWVKSSIGGATESEEVVPDLNDPDIASDMAVFKNIFLNNMQFIDELYKEEVMSTGTDGSTVSITLYPNLQQYTVGNNLPNPIGGTHCKFIVLFDETMSIGYTGGIDLIQSRASDSNHESSNTSGTYIEYNRWHDIQARIEGNVVDKMYGFYVNMWNEAVQRETDDPTYFMFRQSDGTKNKRPFMSAALPATANGGKITAATIPKAFTGCSIADGAASDYCVRMSGDQYANDYSSTAGLHKALSLRTLPNTWPFQDISFTDGEIAEIDQALAIAIPRAETYIYIEDQALLSSKVYGYILEALQTSTDVVVLLVTGQSDPDGDQTKDRDTALYYYLLSELEDDQKNRVQILQHNSATIHSKLFMVDDTFCMIGSANMFDRSLTTLFGGGEIEHSVAFWDATSANTIQEFRSRLWNEHLRIDQGLDGVTTDDISTWLQLWNPAWTGSGGVSGLPALPALASDSQLDNFAGLTKNLSGSGLPKSFRAIVAVFTGGTPVASAASDFVSATTTSFECSTLITDTDLAALSRGTVRNLNNYYVVFLTGNCAGSVRRISSHTGHTLGFSALADTPDSTSTIAILQPYLSSLSLADVEAHMSYINLIQLKLIKG